MSVHSKVRDVLVPLNEYPHLHEGAAVGDAFALLFEGNASGQRYRHVLVLGERGQLVGVVGLRDLLKAILPDYLRATLPGRYEGNLPAYPALSVLWDDSFDSECGVQAAKPIGPHAAPVPTTVTPDDPLTRATYMMVITEQSMLPVVDGETLVGVVRLVDMFNHAAEVICHG